jgi:hypothetical protein
MLAQYSVELREDRKHLQKVSHPRLSHTPFRSPQLALFDLGPGDWLLYWKIPEYAPAQRKRRQTSIVQLPLFEQEPLDLAVGTDETGGVAHPRTHLHLVGEQTQGQEPEE